MRHIVLDKYIQYGYIVSSIHARVKKLKTQLHATIMVTFYFVTYAYGLGKLFVEKW
jgi:hypothetical protein